MIQLTERRNRDIRFHLSRKFQILYRFGDLEVIHPFRFVTIESVASYYQVDIRTIRNIVFRNRWELELLNMKLYDPEFFVENEYRCKNVRQGKLKLFVTFKDGNKIKVSHRGILLFSRRAVLCVGLLLKNSEVAEKIRMRILDKSKCLDKDDNCLISDEEINAIYKILRAPTLRERNVAIAELKRINHNGANNIESEDN